MDKNGRGNKDGELNNLSNSDKTGNLIHVPGVFSIIASEEHAVHRILEVLDKEGIIDGSVADKTFSSGGMINRYRFEDVQQIQDYKFDHQPQHEG